MRDPLSILARLHRPALLMRAARIGAQEYKRQIHLPRLLGYGALPRHGAALFKLIELEADLDDQRKTSDAAYRLLRHIDVLIAVVGEAQILRASLDRSAAQKPGADHIKLSGSAAFFSAT